MCRPCLRAFGSARAGPARAPQPALRRQRSAPLTPQDVLSFWFGTEPHELRAALWLKGLDPDDPRKQAAPKVAARFVPWIRAWGADPMGGEVPPDWQASCEGLVALVVLFDSLPKLAFEGTAEMFAYGPLARRYAATALTRQGAGGEGGCDAASASDQLPWPFRLFCHLAPVSGEELAPAVAGAAAVTQLAEELNRGKTGKGLATGRAVHKHYYVSSAKPAVALLRQFGRDPQRNVLLGRSSTPAELVWLRTKRALPPWARPPEPPGVLQRALSGTGLRREPSVQPRLRVLVLHGRTQNRETFKKQASKAFAPLREMAELVFADAPHMASSGMGGRSWWNAVADPSVQGGMQYVGLDKSLAHLADLAAGEGPFDGVLGFSQGACLAGILAALPVEQRGGLGLRFVVLISGFYCRDIGRATLHLERLPERHAAPPAVEPRRHSISMPSFHIRGTGDAKVEAWRTLVLRDCFANAQEATHPGGHLAVEQWPMAEVAEWLRQFPPHEAAKNASLELRGEVTAQSRFQQRCELLRRLPRLDASEGATVGVPDSPPVLFSCTGLLSSPVWQKLRRTAPILSRGSFTPAEGRLMAMDAVSEHGEGVLEDVFLLAWHLYPFSGLQSLHRQAPRDARLRPELRQWGLEEGKGFLWLFHAAWALAPPGLREMQLWHLATYGGWADLAQLGLLAATGAAKGWAADGTEAFYRQCVPGELTEQLLVEVAEVFAEQLQQDNARAAQVIAEVSGDEGRSDGAARQIARILDVAAGRYVLPSDCVRAAPRFGSSAQRAGDLALRVAARLHELRFGITVTDRERYRARLDSEYRGVLRRLTQCLDLHSTKRLQELQLQEKHVWSRAFMSAEEFERMRRSPVSDAILNPVPEPVEIAPESELAPLYKFLASGAGLRPNALGDMTFDRGTVTTDRRLDLCKQVIGPAGVAGLFDALAKDRQSQKHVQHLLLGNNICGEELPKRVAEYIRRGSSQLTTWYIAGNRLTGRSLQPLCDALEGDQQVRQLWLKRNPLRADGAERIARVLRVNTYLQVLDVSFCGLLDAGAEALVHALGVNQTLRHIYLDANGLSDAAARQLAKLLRAGSQLETLSVGLNRLYDGGAQALAGALGANESLRKLCVASCGIGAAGVEALAGALWTNRALVELDVGFLKATAATGELPNRAQDQGCLALADALARNPRLRALRLSHNGVGLEGRRALRDALCGEAPNTALLALEREQLSMPREPQSLRDEIAAALLRNLAALPDQERAEAERTLRAHHLAEIASVYRLGNMYSPGPPSGDSSLPSAGAPV